MYIPVYVCRSLFIAVPRAVNELLEIVYVITRNPAFCLAFYLACVHFQSELQQVGHVGEQNINHWRIRTRDTGGVKLQDELQAWSNIEQKDPRLFDDVVPG